MSSVAWTIGIALSAVLGNVGVATSAEPAVQITTETSPAGLHCVNVWDDNGGLVGRGCFNNVGDYVFAYDAKADGLWVRTNWEADYGRKGECKDENSEGDGTDCNFDMREDGKLRFQVELWDGDARKSATEWSGWLPIGQ